MKWASGCDVVVVAGHRLRDAEASPFDEDDDDDDEDDDDDDDDDEEEADDALDALAPLPVDVDVDDVVGPYRSSCTRNNSTSFAFSDRYLAHSLCTGAISA